MEQITEYAKEKQSLARRDFEAVDRARDLLRQLAPPAGYNNEWSGQITSYERETIIAAIKALSNYI